MIFVLILSLKANDNLEFLKFINAVISGHQESVLALATSKSGIDVNKGLALKGSKEGMSAIMFAARDGHDVIVKDLIQLGAKVNQKDKLNRSALMFASMNGNDSVKILLKNKAKANEALKYKGALMFAIEKNKYEVAKLLIKHKAGAFIRDYRLWNSLFYAVRYSDVKMFKLILKEIEFDKNPKTGKDDNLFLIASLKKGNVEILKEINKLKIIDVNAKNIIGETALIVAVKNNHIKNIKYLLSIGANPSIKDINGLNAYHFAETRGYKNALIELNKYNITISSK